jgi:hypothetical protein
VAHPIAANIKKSEASFMLILSSRAVPMPEIHVRP